MESTEANKKEGTSITRKSEKPHYPVIPLESDEFNKFIKLLDVINLNWESLEQMGAWLKCWQLLDREILQIHIKNNHKSVMPTQFATRELFLGLWKENGKINNERTIVWLFDVMQIKHLLPKLEEYIRKSATHVKQNESSKVEASSKQKTSQNQAQPINEAGKTNKLGAQQKEKITIEYRNPDKKDLEIEFFKSKIWDMMDHMAKKQEQANEKIQLIEHKLDMLVHKLSLASPELNVLPLIGNNAFFNIFPKVYSTKQVEFFSYLAEQYDNHLNSKGVKKSHSEESKVATNEHQSIIGPRVSNDLQSDEIEIIQDPSINSNKELQHQQSLDASRPQSFPENPPEISLISASPVKLTEEINQWETVDISEVQEMIPSINEACTLLNEVNEASG